MDETWCNNVVSSGIAKTIDEERQRRGQARVLPLLKEDRENFHDGIFSLPRDGAEKRKLYFHMFFAVPVVLYGLYCMFMDYTVYNIVKAVQEHGEVRAVVVSPIKIEASGTGGGIISGIYGDIILILKEATEDNKIGFDNLRCLPNPSEPHFPTYLEILAYMILLFVLCYFDYVIIRLRPKILGLFYPDRLRPRSVYLL